MTRPSRDPLTPSAAFAADAGGSRSDEGRRDGTQRAVYVISVAAELAGVHPQTLRVYERKGLVDPSRTGGGNRRYSERDIERLRRIGMLTGAGLNLEGVRRVLALEDEVERLQRELERVRDEAREVLERTHRHYRRDLVPLRQALVARSAPGAARSGR
jgi:MerR family transcriptional regulator, heat shock protein HspR